MSVPFSGILEIEPKGFGFVRPLSLQLQRKQEDVYVPASLIDNYNLRTGVSLEGVANRDRNGKTQVQTIEKVNELLPEEWVKIKEFSEYDVVQPSKMIRLAKKEANASMRIVELFCPIGKGQRALIVSPPKAGKTMFLQQLAHAISANNPDIDDVLVLLIDERPEEVTDMKRSIRGQVFASSSDSERGDHVHLAQLVLEYAKRKVETGKDVVLLIDSLTRMGRAFNIHQRSSGHTMSGGVDARALEIPKRLFGAARKLEHGGSLTIIATVLVDTGSRMDELIFQEFKGTGNMELILNRDLANERIFPAINLQESGTRREELIFGDKTETHQALRRSIARMSQREAMLSILKLVGTYKTNDDLLAKF
jgi:transcription termination factor Rho